MNQPYRGTNHPTSSIIASLHVILSAFTHPALILSNDGTILEANKECLALTTLLPDDIVNKNYFQLCSLHGIPCVATSIEKLMKPHADNMITHHEINNQIKTFQWTTTVIPFTPKKTVFLLQAYDIGVLFESSRKEQILRDTLLDHLPAQIFWKDKRLIYLGCNKAFAESIGLQSRQEIIGKSDFDLPVDQNDSIQYQAIDKQIMASRQSQINIIERQTLSNGTEKILSTSKVPLCNDVGDVYGVMGIYIDITHLKKIEADLIVAKEAAEAANHAKTEFIANMSHDIRTPLTGVVGMSKMLEDSVSDVKQKSYAHMLGESGDQLLHMLNGILDVVSAESVNENDLHQEPFSLSRMIQDIVELERPTTLVKGIELIATIDTAIPSLVLSDHTKLHRILLNLLGNAIKFTKVGHVDIGATLLKRDDDHAVIQFHVKDTGIGIPYELQDKVFDRFFRVTPSYKGIYTGHGVGLHIAQSYAHLLGGNILLSSEPNVGTTFYFDLSLRIAKEAVECETSNQNNPDEQPVISPNSTAPMLLLVEDNAIALMILENLVTEHACNFMRAVDGREALNLATTHHFDLIITDLGLPGLSGSEFTQQLRVYEQEHHQAPTPIIGLTAHADMKVKHECVQSGMNEAYTKPLTAQALEKIKATYLADDDTAPTQAPVDTPSEENIGNLGADLPETDAQLFELNGRPLLDANAALKLLNNNIQLFNATLTSIVDKELALDLTEIERAHAQGDWAAVERIAHRMKGGFVCCGIARLALACQYLERYHKAGHTVYREKLYQQVLSVADKTEQTLKRWLAMQ